MTDVRRIFLGCLAITLTTLGCEPNQNGASPDSSATAVTPAEVIQTYSEIVYRNYRDAHADALKLQAAIDAFLADPTDQTLAAAKQAWLISRDSYGQTEAFRFYEGPIDFVDQTTGDEGPEGLINAWPLNEAYIDYVKDNPGAGIIQMADVPITRKLLIEKNAADDEANVSTGYHAIEFLLWGQDLSTDGPGARPVSDFAPGDPARDRRRQYLKISTDLLVDHLQGLVEQWTPGKPNYRADFEKMDQSKVIGHILTGLATLTGFELASERLAVPLDSGEQEDEHSCFSDNTHNDFIANAKGIQNVYLGQYGDFKGVGVNQLVAQADADRNARLEAKLSETLALARGLDAPIDQTLASPKGSPRRAKMEALVKALQEQAKLLKQLSEPLGVDVLILAE